MKSKKKIKVVYKKLGRSSAWGQAAKFIEIDPRATGKKQLEILLHEGLHVVFPDLSEEAVVNAAVLLTNTLWSEDFRRVDNRNSIPLQDGSK
jgi:hypothetical protein